MESFLSKSRHHGFLTRMFLRDCAFLVKLRGRSDSYQVWTFATLSLSITLSSCALLIFFGIAVLFPATLPAELHPMTAPKQVVLIEGAVIYALIGIWVDYGLREFKHDMSPAACYINRSDLVKWWLATLLTFGCMIGVGLLVIASGEGYI